MLISCLLLLFLVAQGGAERNKRRGDNSHFCCTIEMPITFLTRSRTKVEYKQEKTMIVVGSEPCGFTQKCPIYKPMYRLEPEYFTEYYTVPKQDPCPSSKVACCQGYIEKDGQCLTFDEILRKTESIDEVLKLIGQSRKTTETAPEPATTPQSPEPEVTEPEIQTEAPTLAPTEPPTIPTEEPEPTTEKPEPTTEEPTEPQPEPTEPQPEPTHVATESTADESSETKTKDEEFDKKMNDILDQLIKSKLVENKNLNQ